MTTFFAMGGYAKWVWGAFGFTLLILVFNVMSARARLRRISRELQVRNAVDSSGVQS